MSAERPADWLVSRLTAGWRHSSQPSSLREHDQRYGELPRHSRQLIAEVEAAGLTGRGGAGFPTGAKLRAVAERRRPAVVVANGMESEPGSEKDQALLARAPHLVLDGIELAAGAVGADVAYLCLPHTRGWLTDIVSDAIEQRRRAGVDRFPAELVLAPQDYVASEETALVHWLNGGEAKPTVTPPRPFERGVRKRPTLVDNVETLAHLALIARYGAAWFRQAGAADAPGSMLVTVSGAVAEPGVYEIAGGTRVGEVLAAAHGSDDVSGVLLGGYFGTWHPVAEVAGLAFTKSGLGQVGGAPGSGVLFALDSRRCGLAEAAHILDFLARNSARQCGPCLFGLPAIAADMASLAAGQGDDDVLERLHRRFAQITGRGACRHPDGAVRMAASALAAFAADTHAHARRRPCLAAHRGRQRTLALSVPQVQEEWR